MTKPYVAYQATANQSDFVVPFPFLSRTHVKVKVNGVPALIMDWPNSSTLRLFSPVPDGTFVEIVRETPVDTSLVTFSDGNILNAADLNTAVTQLLYRQQEISDLYERNVEAGLTRIAAAGGVVLPVDDLFNSVVAELSQNATVENFQQRVGEIDLNAANILTNAQELIDKTAEIAAVSLRADSLDSTAANLQTQANGLRTDLTTLTGVVDSLAGGDPGTGIATLIQAEETARIAGDQAIVNTIDLIGAKSGDNLSFIADLNTLRVSPGESFAQRFSSLSAADANNAASIASESTARANAVAAEAARIDLLTTRVGDAEADIITEQTARANGDAAEAAQRTLLEARVTAAEGDITAAEAAILTEQFTRANADSAIAADIALLGASNAGGNAFVLDQSTVQVTAGETLASRLSGINTSIGNNTAALAAEETARINADNAEAAARSALAARVTTAEGDITTNAAAITAESTARANAISAEAAARNALAARVTTAESDITAAESAILTEQIARAAGDNSLASDMSLLGAKNAGGNAWILNENTVQVSGGATLGTRLSGIDTSIGNANAAIAAEEVARINGDNTLAASVVSLQTTVNGNTASVNTLQSSVNGLEAKYGVTLDVNGYVTGFAQNNDGQTGVFQILADKFQIVDPAGGPGAASLVPFEVSGGIVKIKNAAIDNLDVGKLASGALAANITQNGDWNVGTGKIIWDNGSYMKVSGVGFGTSNQFIEWFGPKMAINLCSEANATQYLKTNGDAYFGGSLSAGVLKNSGQSTSIASDALIEIGPFGTNGGSINVVTSYNAQTASTATYADSAQGRTDWNNAVSAWGATPEGIGEQTVSGSKALSVNVTIPVSRTEAGTGTNASWASLTITSATQTISGMRTVQGDGESFLTYVTTLSGSITSTDAVGGTNNRTFKATITNRTGIPGTFQFQNLSIVATE